MVLEARQDLIDGGGGAVRKLHEHGNRRLHARLPGTERLHFDGSAGAREIPERKVEEVDGLLQDPRADAGLVVAPARRALPIGMAEQRDVDVLRAADGAFIDERADAAPLRREPTLQPDAQLRPGCSRRGDDAVAVRNRVGHRLLEQHVLAGLERGDRNRRMEMVGRGDGDGLDPAGPRSAPPNRDAPPRRESRTPRPSHWPRSARRWRPGVRPLHRRWSGHENAPTLRSRPPRRSFSAACVLLSSRRPVSRRCGGHRGRTGARARAPR